LLTDVKGEPLRPGRYLLASNESEEPGNGLYSYLLIGERPDRPKHQTYIDLMESFLRLAFEVGEYERLKVDQAKRNIMYVPVTAMAPKEIASSGGRQLAEWIVDHYDHARARDLMSRGGRSTSGPLLLSLTRPLGREEAGDRGVTLSQDLSIIGTHLWPAALREMLLQQSQDGAWDGASLSRIAWKVRVAIAVLAESLDQTASGLDLWSRVVKAQ
jgi:hypothetical protein